MSAEFIESTHGKKQLCYLGYRYCFKRKNQNGSEYWVCVKCTATATSYSDLSVVVCDEHTHLPDETDKIVLEMRKNLKRKAIEDSGPIDRIFEEAYHIINIKSNDLIVNLPSINTLKNNLQKHRRKTRPRVPRSIEQLPLPLPDVYCKTTQGDWFLLYDGLLGGTRSLIFSTYNDIVYLSQQQHWYSDGTFYTCPSIFYQIYSIHAYYDGISTPCVFALLGAISLLPLHHMLWDLQYLVGIRPNCPGIQAFLDYYHNTFGPFSRFLPHMYNHYRNITPRTINYLEG
ncbi:unnamed protein product [Rotaria sordida]|uniref:FLYWCH-type domain-containing protein n=1 Tax=Rotaria sordida TaxID=392033 RepID=A0A813U2U4_9BILA|nr:unnamed protein product [Rotaria sordida]